MSEVSDILKHARTILNDSRIPDCPSNRLDRPFVSRYNQLAKDVLVYYASHHMISMEQRKAMRQVWNEYSAIVECHSRVPEGFADNIATLLDDIANLGRDYSVIMSNKRTNPLVCVTMVRAAQLRKGVYFSRGFLSPTVSLVAAMKEKGIPCESLEAKLSVYNAEVAKYCAETTTNEQKNADTRI